MTTFPSPTHSAGGFLVCWALVMSGGAARAQPFAYVANQRDNSVSVIDTAADQVVGTVPVGMSPGGVSVHPNGAMVFVANFDSGSISVIDVATNTVVNTITGLVRPNKIAVTPSGDRVYVSQNTIPGFVAVIDTATNSIVSEVETGMLPNWMVMSPDGSAVYVVNTWDTAENNPCYLTPRCFLSISRIDTETHVETRVNHVGIQLTEITASPDGSRLFIAGHALEGPTNGAVYVRRTEDLTGFWIPVEAALGVVVHPSGNPLYISAAFPKVLIMDTRTNQVTDSIDLEASASTARTAAITPDARKLYVVDNFPDGTVVVVNVVSKNVITTIPVGDNPVAIAIGPKMQVGTPSTPTATPSPMAVQCFGDCDGDASVTVDEIVTMVNIALGDKDVSDCPKADADADGRVTVDEIQTAVVRAVEGCM